MKPRLKDTISITREWELRDTLSVGLASYADALALGVRYLEAHKDRGARGQLPGSGVQSN